MSRTLRFIQDSLSGHVLTQTHARGGVLTYTYHDREDDVIYTVTVLYWQRDRVEVITAFAAELHYSTILSKAAYMGLHVGVAMHTNHF